MGQEPEDVLLLLAGCSCCIKCDEIKNSPVISRQRLVVGNLEEMSKLCAEDLGGEMMYKLKCV